jgi:glycosyltransferase involved in cell wall biosynthesis
MVTVGVAICCYNGHLPKLKRLFDSIERQTRQPDDVVVSCSSTTLQEVTYRRDMYTFPFRILIHAERKSAAENRNYAAGQLQTDVVSFFDADDIMHPQRLAIIADAFDAHPSLCLFLHNTEFGTSMEFPRYPTVYLYMNQLGQCEWGSTVLKVPLNEAHIANGHVSVRRRVIQEGIAYPEGAHFRGREDTVFTTEIIRRWPNQTAYCRNVLSRYEPSGTGGML